MLCVVFVCAGHSTCKILTLRCHKFRKLECSLCFHIACTCFLSTFRNLCLVFRVHCQCWEYMCVGSHTCVWVVFFANLCIHACVSAFVRAGYILARVSKWVVNRDAEHWAKCRGFVRTDVNLVQRERGRERDTLFWIIPIWHSADFVYSICVKL